MQEKLSALMDGEWDDHELEQLMAAIDEDDDCGDAWHHYHLIGDALNQRPILSDQFMDRFAERLAAEPLVMAPVLHRRRPALRKRWVAMSMAASVALVGATAWYVSRAGAMTAVPAETQLIAAAAKPLEGVEVGANPYLMAHQALIGNPGYVRHRPVVLSGSELELPAASH